MGLPPGQWCTVTLEDDGLRWELPKNGKDWQLVSLEYDRGMYRQRVGDADWSQWMPVRVH